LIISANFCKICKDIIDGQPSSSLFFHPNFFTMMSMTILVTLGVIVLILTRMHISPKLDRQWLLKHSEPVTCSFTRECRGRFYPEPPTTDCDYCEPKKQTIVMTITISRYLFMGSLVDNCEKDQQQLEFELLLFSRNLDTIRTRLLGLIYTPVCDLWCYWDKAFCSKPSPSFVKSVCTWNVQMPFVIGCFFFV
jgi:hypothetical protein